MKPVCLYHSYPLLSKCTERGAFVEWPDSRKRQESLLDFPVIAVSLKNETVLLREDDTRRLLINRIRKRQATFFGHTMRRENLEHLVTTGMIDGKRSTGKQRENMLDGQTEWLKVGRVTEALRATRIRDAW